MFPRQGAFPRLKAMASRLVVLNSSRNNGIRNLMGPSTPKAPICTLLINWFNNAMSCVTDLTWGLSDSG